MISDSDDRPDPNLAPKGSPVWLWPNLLSLDAPVVAVVWQWLFAVSLRIKIPWEIYATLGVTVWIIYVADRLFDARKLIDPGQSTPRHRFYREHSGFFYVFIVAAIAVDVWLLLFHVPTGLYRGGIMMGLLVVTYFFFRFLPARSPQSGAPREVLCGFIFAMGSVVSVYFYSGESINALYSTPHPILLALLFSGNCVAIAHWEASSDAANGDTSIATTAPRTGRDLIFALGLLALIGCVMQFVSYPDYGWPIYTAIFLGALGLLGLKFAERRMSTNALRVLADVVLLTPLILVPVVLKWMSIR